MHSRLSNFLLLALLFPANAFAQAAGQPQLSSAGFFSGTLWFLAFGIAGYYFLVTRPMLAKEADQKKFIASLKRNDEIITSGGIYGRVNAVTSDSVTIEVAPNVRIKVRPENIQPPPTSKSEEPAKKSELASKK